MKSHLHAVTLFGLAGAVALTGACSKSTGDGSTPNVSAGVQSLLFIKRQHTTTQNGTVSVDVAGGNGQVLDYQRFVPGGSLNLLAPARPDGTVSNLTSGFPTAAFSSAHRSFAPLPAAVSLKTHVAD